MQQIVGNHKNRQTFNDRLNLALENHPEAPGKDHGSLRWVVEQLAKRGVKVTNETVRRWLNDSIPRPDKLEALADALDVDQQWLMFGSAEERPKPIATPHSPAVQAVAAVLALRRIPYEVPDPSDTLSQMRGVNLHIKAAMRLREIHCTTIHNGDKLTFTVPPNAHSVPIIGVYVNENLCLRIYEVSFEEVFKRGENRGGNIVASFDADDPAIRQVTDFTDA